MAFQNAQFTCLLSTPTQTDSSSSLSFKGKGGSKHPNRSSTVPVICMQQLSWEVNIYLESPGEAVCTGRLRLLLLTLTNKTGCHKTAACLGGRNGWEQWWMRCVCLAFLPPSWEVGATAHLLQLGSALKGKPTDFKASEIQAFFNA